jgi:membrane fusion protein (multidrug efflux system)
MVISLIGMSALAGCDRKPAAAPVAPPQQVGVVVLQAEQVVSRMELPGRTSAMMTADVRPQVNGVILKRLFTEGNEVEAGQQLYQIDPATYQAAYESALGTLASDEAALTTAEARARRYKPLSAAQAVSSQDYDDAVATAKQAQGNIAIARANVTAAKINLDYTKVLSPIAGHIGRSLVTPGALVTANQTSVLATVTQLDPIYVDLNQPVTTLLRLRQETEAGRIQTASDGSAAVALKLEDGSAYAIPGKLQFTEVTEDESTGTVVLRAIFPNPRHLLLPGMYVHAELQEGIDPNGILVPQQAVSRNTHGDPTVLIVGEGNKAELRVIQTSSAVGDQWVVTGGLKPGERVIVDGLSNLRPGALVQPVAANLRAAPGGKKS